MVHAYAYAMQMQCNYGAKHLRCYIMDGDKVSGCEVMGYG
jgi:hypothetical protein